MGGSDRGRVGVATSCVFFVFCLFLGWLLNYLRASIALGSWEACSPKFSELGSGFRKKNFVIDHLFADPSEIGVQCASVCPLHVM